jgi:hypothetical protein
MKPHPPPEEKNIKLDNFPKIKNQCFLFFSQVVTGFDPRIVSFPHQTVRFCAAVHLTGDGLAFSSRHVRVDALPCARVRVFPHPAPEYRAIDIAFVDVRLRPAVRTRKPIHDFHGRHFFCNASRFF